MNKILKKVTEESGYTLVELLWATLLTLLVLASVLGALQVGMRSTTVASKTTFFVDRGTAAVRTMQKHIRQAAVLAETDSNYLRITVERSSVENVFDTYEFYIFNRKLYKRVNGKEKVIVENVVNQDVNVPLFRYFKEGGQEITDPTLRKSFTRSIQITVVMDDNLNEEPPQFTVSEMVALRNFNF